MRNSNNQTGSTKIRWQRSISKNYLIFLIIFQSISSNKFFTTILVRFYQITVILHIFHWELLEEMTFKKFSFQEKIWITFGWVLLDMTLMREEIIHGSYVIYLITTDRTMHTLRNSSLRVYHICDNYIVNYLRSIYKPKLIIIQRCNWSTRQHE